MINNPLDQPLSGDRETGGRPLDEAQLQKVRDYLCRLAKSVTKAHDFQVLRRDREDDTTIEYQIFADTSKPKNGSQIAWVQSTRHDAEFISAVLAQAPLFDALLASSVELSDLRAARSRLEAECQEWAAAGLGRVAQVANADALLRERTAERDQKQAEIESLLSSAVEQDVRWQNELRAEMIALDAAEAALRTLGEDMREWLANDDCDLTHIQDRVLRWVDYVNAVLPRPSQETR